MSMANLAAQKYSVYRCIGCGVCKGGYESNVSPCPMWVSSGGFEHETPRGIITLARAILEGRLDYSRELSDVVYRCTGCGNCRELCGSVDLTTGSPLINPMEIAEAMKADALERGFAPPVVRDYLQNIYRYGNPWKMPRDQRGEWARDAEIKQFEAGTDYLYFVDCTGSYDPRANAAARMVGRLLVRAGLSVGILGERENCSGNEVKKLGEGGLFQYLVEENMKTFQELGVKKIVALSPHAYNAFKKDYPRFGGAFEVVHYTQLLRDLLREGRLSTKKRFDARLTYHDPCFLGRHNGEYEAPREILKAVRGVELLEMPRTRQNALCCGGGGGNFYTDLVGGRESSPARIRVREAYGVGAEVLVVACPVCMVMFEDAVKAEGLERVLKVMDCAEVIGAALE